MENTTKVTVNIAGTDIVFESGLLAQQAGGSLTATYGDNVLFCSACSTKKPREGIDFFPLQIEYREKFYAAGRFPGGFFKREARPGENEILTARVTDRPIRPLFPEGYRNDVQIIINLLSTDATTYPDFLSINIASAALTISEIPFMGPIGAVRVGRVNGEFIINPTHEQDAEGDLNLVYVGNREFPLMIEGDSKEINNADIVAAMRLAHVEVVKLIDAQLELRTALGLPEKVIDIPKEDTTFLDSAREIGKTEFIDIMQIGGKHERHDKVNAFKESLRASLNEKHEDLTDEAFRKLFDDLEIEVVRENALERGKRIDGRAFDELRDLTGQVGILPRTHGSAIFGRGETQALATITLGTNKDTQNLDAISGGITEKKFMLHYNFPPYSVGECGRIGSTGRREIGHGNLAERSLMPVVPEDYPYTIRVVSEVMGSNGSSSMASACAGTLAMMDAGIPISKPVAGISVGLYSSEAKSELVVDILGVEDHCGDMDFKVCGTRDGITGFQVDLKIHGLPWDLVEGAFEMAQSARIKILDQMATVLAEPREEIAEHAPRITTLKIDPEKIGALIGPGGKHIRGICDTYSVQIDVDDDGNVSIFAVDKESLDGALREVGGLTADAEIGRIYDGTVRGVKDFGAFVEILPGKEGLVHISELADYRVQQTEDICKMGDQMWVKCLNVDDSGKIRLSRKAALAEMDEGGDKDSQDKQDSGGGSD